jgi:LmbE family N-acetylglucosaminyl deacetylase
MSETAWNAPNLQNEFMPNVYVDISDTLESKLTALSFFETQLSDFPDARSIEAIEALAKYRGALMHLKAAEAFMLIRELK